MNFLHSKMFVSNDLTKGSQTKSPVKKCYLNRNNNHTFSSTKEIQKKTEEILSASLVCIFSFTTLRHKIIYHV